MGYRNDVKIDFSRPGKPSDNAFVESFNGTFRSECLNIHWFIDLKEASQLIEAWRQEYNESRPHVSLDDRTPSGFASNLNRPRTNTNLGTRKLGPSQLRYTNSSNGTKDRALHILSQ